MKTGISFTPEDIKQLEPAEKIGLLATVNTEGKPHITLITSMQPVSEKGLAFGEFSRGVSKHHVRVNPGCAFLMMTPDRALYRGTALWTGARDEGPEYVMFNEKPMFRYNSYFGINRVHYLDSVKNSGKEKLPLLKIIQAVVLTGLSKKSRKKGSEPLPLNRLALSFFNRASSLKFISYINSEGFPVIIPLFQCRAVAPDRLIFSPAAYKDELKLIPEGSECAVFVMTLNMESLLTRGVFDGFRRSGAVKTGSITIDWVYNSMPPVHGQIFPPVPLEPVREF